MRAARLLAWFAVARWLGACATAPAPLGASEADDAVPALGATPDRPDAGDAAAATPEADAADLPAARPETVRWRFGAGAPVAAAPAVASDGSVYVATTEGKVHKIGPDGSFRWTHNVVGAVTGSPAVGAQGVVYVGNAQGYVHALLPGGSSLWGFWARSPVVSDLAVGRRGEILFATRKQQLVALSSKAGALWRANLGGVPSTGPGVGPKGTVVLGTTDGLLLRFTKAQRQGRVQLEGVVLQQTLGVDGTAYAIAGETLYVVSTDGKIRWRVGPAHAVGLAPATGDVVVMQRDQLVWWTPEGEPGRKVPLGVEASAGLALDARGCVYVPSATGELWVVAGDGGTYRAVVGQGPVNRPVVDSRRGQVIAAAGGGQVAAIAACAPPRQD